MFRDLSRLLLVTGLVAGMTSAAAAYQAPDLRSPSSQLPSGTALADTTPALPPLAFVQFCDTYRGQCASDDNGRSVTLDARSWAELQRVNARVNEAIAPDRAKDGYDWSLATRFGNCNDYAVQKRDALLRLGYPMAALSLAVVRTAFGEGHLVLTIRTDRGDFVLDNRRASIVAWNRTGYSWIKRQSAEDPRAWVAVSAGPRRPVAPAVTIAARRAPIDEPGERKAGPAPADLPLPAVGLASYSAGFTPIGAGAAAISHAAAGRQLAMLALDALGGWATRTTSELAS